MKTRTSIFIEQLNPWWQGKTFRFNLYPRDDYTQSLIKQRNRLIHILIGARRVGKTSILHAVINQLLSAGINHKHIIFLTGELREVKENGIRNTLEQILAVLNIKNSAKLHIFIDEVQEIPNWQADVKLLYDATAYQLYLSGSSSFILNKQTSKLTGRFKLRHVLPLSFQEFLLFRSIRIPAARLPATKLKHALNEYLKIGGYPEYVINRDPAYLRQCIESTLYRELISAYGMRNPALLQDLLYFLADKITNVVSVKRIQKDLKIDDKTSRFYLQYLQDVYLIYPVFREGKSNRVTKGSNPKYYFNDLGVLALMSKSFRIGHAVENAVFLKLLNNVSSQEQPRIEYAIIDEQEVDFLCDKQFYEVKALEEINAQTLETYSDLGKEIKLITLGNVQRFKNYSSNLKLVSLKDFV